MDLHIGPWHRKGDITRRRCRLEHKVRRHKRVRCGSDSGTRGTALASGLLGISTKANRARLDLPGTQGMFAVSVGITTSC